ncbi:rhodanese-like domain-containing protein [Cohnella suwonensis]|uniref:Rhodanese-like domain-containing protein n=1 Tax=Cohnella suwonensis TaxID=696072 RepID=A0ABW0LX37_9BACL
MNTTTIIGLLLIAAIAVLIVRGRRAVGGMANYTPEQFEEKLKGTPKPVLVDVREPSEYGSGHLAGAVNLPLSGLRGSLGKLPKDREILLYCRSGMRSKQAGAVLRGNGIENLGHLQGGISSWKGKVVR